MPDNSTSRKLFSALVAAEDDYSFKNAVDTNYATVTVGGTGTVDNIGVALIWDDTNTRFEKYVAQDIAAAISTGGSPLPDGSVICLSVGNNQGKGFNDEDTDISVAGTKMTVLYRGDVTVIPEGIEWNGAVEADQNEFLAQLQKQRITTIAQASDATATYLDA